ncbi:hypothetical protein C8R46DRAFT_1214538 [Mycena filopes]|nr:hypothetical protein C8R46DRAFT_1214538 [Mycena filopes]
MDVDHPDVHLGGDAQEPGVILDPAVVLEPQDVVLGGGEGADDLGDTFAELSESSALTDRMLQGHWRVHEALGSVICESALKVLRGEQGEEPDFLECNLCIEYFRHVGAGVAMGDASLNVALRRFDTTSGRGSRVNGRSRGWRKDVRDTAREHSAQLVDACHSYVLMKEKYNAERAIADKLELRVAQLQRELDDLGERPRKRSTPSGTQTTNTPCDTPRIPQNALGAPVVLETSIHAPALNRDMKWTTLTGIPLQIVSYRVTNDNQISPQYPDALLDARLVVFAAYLEARRLFEENKTLSELQIIILALYTMPKWFVDAFRSCTIDAASIRANRHFWSNCSHPAYRASVFEVAAYVQRHGRVIEGCPFLDEFHSLNSEAVAGYMIWTRICFPPSKSTTGCANWITYLLLELFAVPRAYAELITKLNLTIAPIPNLVNLTHGVTPTITSEEVTARLAAMGFSLELADNLFRFAANLLSEINLSPDGRGLDRSATLALHDVQKQEVNWYKAPANSQGFIITRAPGLPWPEKYNHLTLAQEYGVFIKDIPIPPETDLGKNGRITLLTGSKPFRKHADRNMQIVLDCRLRHRRPPSATVAKRGGVAITRVCTTVGPSSHTPTPPQRRLGHTRAELDAFSSSTTTFCSATSLYTGVIVTFACVRSIYRIVEHYTLLVVVRTTDIRPPVYHPASGFGPPPSSYQSMPPATTPVPISAGSSAFVNPALTHHDYMGAITGAPHSYDGFTGGQYHH